MSTEIVNFNFDQLPIRVVTIDGDPWFLASDACAALDLNNVGQALAPLVEEEKSYIILDDVTIGTPKRTVVNESGLYDLIMRSRKPEAQAFRRWVTSEVLPSIRKTGRYAIAETEDDVMARGYVIAQNRLKLLENNNAALQAQTAQQAAELEKQKPFAIHGMHVIDTNDLVETTTIAKQLNMSAQQLHLFLRDRRVIYKQSDRWHLYADYVPQGLGRVVTWSIPQPDGSRRSYHILKWTPVGHMFIVNLWYGNVMR